MNVRSSSTLARYPLTRRPYSLTVCGAVEVFPFLVGLYHVFIPLLMGHSESLFSLGPYAPFYRIFITKDNL